MLEHLHCFYFSLGHGVGKARGGGDFFSFKQVGGTDPGWHCDWIINCLSAVKSMISKCVGCRRFRGKVCQQKMVTCNQTDLPRKHLLPIVALTCLIHFWLKMVVNKENIMVQCLQVCPADQCILKLQTVWVLIAS